MKRVLLIATIAVAMLGVSCSKSGDDSPKPEETKTYLLKKHTYKESDNDPFVIEFTYDDKNRLIKTKHEEGYEAYTYDANNNLTKKEEFGSDLKLQTTSTYKYEDNTIAITRQSGDYESSISLQLNDKKQIVKRTESNDVTTYEYDSKGNLIKINGNGYTYTYSYDDKKNPFSTVAANKLLPTLVVDDFVNEGFVNNVNGYSFTGANGSSTTSKVLQYNEDGYPTKISSTYKTYSWEETFEYIVK